MDVVRDVDCDYVEEQNLVSGYLAGRLSDEEADALEKHFFGCEKHWGEVRAGEEVRTAMRRPPAQGNTAEARVGGRRGPWTGWRVLALAAVLGAAAVGAVLVLRARGSGIDALANAAGTRRTTEARLSGPFQYAPVAPIMRGRDDAPLKLRRTALEALEKAQEKPSAETLHAAGVAHLLVDEWDQAIDTLNQAAKLAPNDARILSDLGAAYYTRFLRRDHAADLPPAFENAKHATEIDSKLPVAQYNLALALEGLGRRDEARAAWQAYLAMDPKSGWADEARAREKALSSPPQSELWRGERDRLDAGWIPAAPEAQSLARRFPQQVRQYVEDDLLTGWANSEGATAARFLQMAKTLAAGLAAANGERLALDSVETIERAGSVDALKSGHAHFGLARKSYKAAEIPQALAEFRVAEDIFRNTVSPFVHLTRLGQASCALYGMDAAKAKDSVEQLEVEAERNSARHRALAGQTFWLRALIEDVRGHPYESFRSFSKSLEIFESLGETENIAALHGQLAGQLQMLGDDNAAWVHHLQELALLDRGTPAVRVTNALGAVARLSADQGYARLALLAEDAEGAVAKSSRVPLFESYSNLWRAQLLERMGRTAEARADLASARADCDRITDPGSRNRARAEIELATVRFSSEADTADALASADKAVTFAKSIDDHGRLPELLLIRGRLHSKAGSRELARADFLAGIEALEASRSDVTPQDLRVSYFETGRSLFDEAIENLWQADDRTRAFELADWAHARVLLDSEGSSRTGARVSAADGHRANLSGDLKRALHAGEALVEYWISEHRSKAWVVTANRIEAVPLASATLPAQAQMTWDAISRTTSTADVSLAELYDSTIRPLEPYLSGIRQITFVADGPLYTCPFAALRERHRSRYLVEDFAISLSPSAAFVLVSPSLERPANGMLIFQNPKFDQTQFPSLPSLAAASAEASSIARVAPNARILRGEEATVDALLHISPDYGVIHFAGHAVEQSQDPRMVGLLLAPTNTYPSGILYAHELVSLDLRRTQLIVLSACSTTSGPSSRSEGPLGLSRAFLAAGAQTVVATLWPISDRSSGMIFSAFYRHLGAGTNVAEAVRAAQLETISARAADPQSLRDWAAVIVTGDARRTLRATSANAHVPSAASSDS